MKIRIDAAPGGYAIVFVMDDGTTNTYPETVPNLQEALAYVRIAADEVEQETGERPESDVTVAAIRENRGRDIDAFRVWKAKEGDQP